VPRGDVDLIVSGPGWVALNRVRLRAKRSS
jgi:hypothetical protein